MNVLMQTDKRKKTPENCPEYYSTCTSHPDDTLVCFLPFKFHLPYFFSGGRPDFASRFPISGFVDDQLQQNPRQPMGSFPFQIPSRQERPGMSSDLPTGFIPDVNTPILSQERLQQLAHERIQQMARFPSSDQLGILGFGTDRFSADQPGNQSPQHNMQNAGIIRPSDRINAGQQNLGERNNRPDQGLGGNGNPFRQGAQQNGFAQQNTLFGDQQQLLSGNHQNDGQQFGQSTRGPFFTQQQQQGTQGRDAKPTPLPFWMQGSSNSNSNSNSPQNAPFPLNMFRTDTQRNIAAGMLPPPGTGFLPQPRILHSNMRPAEMTTSSHILDFETSPFGQSLGDATDQAWDFSKTGPTLSTNQKTVTTTATPFVTNTTAKLPWWLESSTNGTLVTSGSTKVPLTVSNVGRNPSMFAKFAKPAETCDKQNCKLPECWCGGSEIPGSLPVGETPQVIMITFDDAVTNQNYHLYTSIFTENRRNPNNCPIRGTFYVSHEWTEYFLVQNLYSDGHEIGSHSVSHTLPGKNFTKHDWADEISGQREILDRFANVKVEDVKGMRAPYLQTGGNNQFEMLWEKGHHLSVMFCLSRCY